MKRLVSLLITVLLVGMLFVGCGTKTTNTKDGDAANAGGKTWVIATDTVFKPFEFTNEKN